MNELSFFPVLTEELIEDWAAGATSILFHLYIRIRNTNLFKAEKTQLS